MVRLNPERTIGGEDNLAERIARERKARGLSYEGLAKLLTSAGCAIQGSAIYKIEKSDPPRRVTVDELIALSRVFDVSVENLLTPIDQLDDERAHQILKEMDEAEKALGEGISSVLEVHAEFMELVASRPDLFQYVRGHRFPDRGDRHEDEGLTPFVDVEGTDYDSGRLTKIIAQFYRDLLDEAGEIAEAIVRSNKEGN